MSEAKNEREGDFPFLLPSKHVLVRACVSTDGSGVGVVGVRVLRFYLLIIFFTLLFGLAMVGWLAG